MFARLLTDASQAYNLLFGGTKVACGVATDKNVNDVPYQETLPMFAPALAYAPSQAYNLLSAVRQLPSGRNQKTCRRLKIKQICSSVVRNFPLNRDQK